MHHAEQVFKIKHMMKTLAGKHDVAWMFGTPASDTTSHAHYMPIKTPARGRGLCILFRSGGRHINVMDRKIFDIRFQQPTHKSRFHRDIAVTQTYQIDGPPW